MESDWFKETVPLEINVCSLMEHTRISHVKNAACFFHDRYSWRAVLTSVPVAPESTNALGTDQDEGHAVETNSEFV